MKLVGLIAALSLGLAGWAQAAPTATDDAAIAALETHLGTAQDKAITTRMAELGVPGVSIAFFENGEVKWTRTYGVATAGGAPVTPETLFQAASMSKAVAATAALRLVDQRRLALDDDVNLRLKGWKVPASPLTADHKVTLRELLSHTAGLTVSGFPGYPAGKPVPTTLQILNGQPPSNTPAVVSWETPGVYAYSGGGYTVAQLMIVEAGGRPYPELLQKLVLGPAGMKASAFDQPLPSARLAQAASGHGVRGLPIQGGRNTYPEYGAAGLWTTPSDYARFMIALQNSYAGRPHALLSKASAQAMMTPVDAGYGLGEVIGSRGGHPYFTHGGSNAGFQCNSIAFLDGSGQGAVVMTNGDAGGAIAGEVLRALGVAYGWGEDDPGPKRSARRAPNVPAAAK